MGAHNMQDRSVGKTMREAYDRAVQNAESEHGYDAYNGTISTTQGFKDKTRKFEELMTRKREGSVKFTVNVGNGFGFKQIDKYFKDMTEDEWHKQCVNDWEEEAWDNTEKWEEVWGALSNKKTNLYIFAGWAAE
jgi:diaminopimelate decarboxylase